MIAGCASNPKYQGPTARISGLGQVEDAVTMRWFTVAEMPAENSLGVVCPSLQSGQAVRSECVGGVIAARPMKVKIRATHVSDTPVAEIARRQRGQFYFVEGVVDFSPKPGGEYVVRGVLAKGDSSVWIEDVVTKQPVTQVLIVSGGAQANDCVRELWDGPPESLSGQATDEAVIALQLLCGVGVPLNEVAGVAQLTSAAERGIDKAQFALGVAYLQGRGVSRDGLKASSWFRHAAYQGMARAAAAMVAIEKNGYNVSSAQWAIFQSVGRNAALGDVESQLQLASWLNRYNGDLKRKASASQWYRAAALQGSVIAQRELGILLLSTEPAESRDWLESAANAGDMPAQLELGVNYQMGRGWDPDPVLAYKWLRLAASKGSNSARYRLGDMYRHGSGLPVKLALTYALYFPVVGLSGDLESQLEKYHPIFEEDMSPEEIELGKKLIQVMAKPGGFLEALGQTHSP
jgi:TPR repeat protein